MSLFIPPIIGCHVLRRREAPHQGPAQRTVPSPTAGRQHGGGSAGPPGRDGGAARPRQSPRGRAEPSSRGDEAVRVRHGDPRGLSQAPVRRGAGSRGAPPCSSAP